MGEGERDEGVEGFGAGWGWGGEEEGGGGGGGYGGGGGGEGGGCRGKEGGGGGGGGGWGGKEGGSGGGGGGGEGGGDVPIEVDGDVGGVGVVVADRPDAVVGVAGVGWRTGGTGCVDFGLGGGGACEGVGVGVRGAVFFFGHIGSGDHDGEFVGDGGVGAAVDDDGTAAVVGVEVGGHRRGEGGC